MLLQPFLKDEETKTEIPITIKTIIQTYFDSKDHVLLTLLSLPKRKKNKPLEDMECFLVSGNYANSLSNLQSFKISEKVKNK